MKATVKKFSDYPQYVALVERLSKVQTEIEENLREQETLRDQHRKGQSQLEKDSAESFMEGTKSKPVDIPGLENRIRALMDRERWLRKAAEIGEQKLGIMKNDISTEICKPLRAEYVAKVRQLLQALETLCFLNAEIEGFLGELRDQDIRSAHILPVAMFPSGKWDDQYGGTVVGFRKYIYDNFPELATPIQTAPKLRRVG